MFYTLIMYLQNFMYVEILKTIKKLLVYPKVKYTKIIVEKNLVVVITMYVSIIIY